MANIKPYLDHIADAEYGEDVRASLINALIKVNNDNDSYNDLKKDVIAAKDAVDKTVDEFDGKVEAASEISKELEKNTESGNQTNSNLEQSISTAQDERKKLESAYANVSKSVSDANTAKSALTNVISDAGAAKKNLDASVNTATATKSDLDESIQMGEQKKKSVDTSVAAAEKVLSNLNTAISGAADARTKLISATTSADESRTNLSKVVENADTSKAALNKSIENAGQAKTDLDSSITSATNTQSALQGVIDSANEIKKNLDTSNTTAATLKKNLDSAITNAGAAKSQLQEVINSAGSIKTSLSDVITAANTAKSNLDASVTKANGALQSLTAENASAASNLEELRGENFNSQEILAGVADIRAYLGITADDVIGIQVDYKNKSFKRLAGAANLSKGSDFDKFVMFGGRKRCNVADDGSITAWYGDDGYTEDGSNGQVMVYQPKFYYLVCPVEYDPIDTGIGYHLRKVNYYVSEKHRAGFRLHPAFYDASGNEIDYFLTSAYEGSIYDASASAYLLNDEQVMSTTEDKFSSIAGARPASGSSQNLTRPNVEAMAQNRGTNWHGDLIKPVSAEQMLMIIEMGMMNLQTAIAQGVVSLPWSTGSDTTSSYAAVTGSTAGLGNGTGRAEKTTTYEGGVAKEYTVDNKTSVCWRGKENFWGNIWKFVYGINIWGNGKMGGGQPYICSDFNFAESKNSGNYEPAGFTVTNANGYISAMGYSTACDWLFIASECLGNSSLPVGDYTYVTANLNTYRIARLGSGWIDGGSAGGFYWHLVSGVGDRGRSIGGRLVYIPTRDSATYTAAIEAWKQKMAV